MFGLFKSKTEDDNRNHPEFAGLEKKWDAFLSKINTRFEASLLNAEEALLDNLVVSDYDLNPTLRAWQGIKAQLGQLSSKVDDTYDNTVAPQMLEIMEEWDIIDQRQKGTQLNESMYRRIERFEIVIEGKVSQSFYNHAIDMLNEQFNCTQCNAGIVVKKDIFRTHYVSCDYCNTVNTFTPNDKINQIRWITDNIAKYKALSEWDTMQEALNSYQDLPAKAEFEDRTALIAAFKIRETAEIAYWSKYLIERYTLLPEYMESFDHDLSVKLKYLYQERKEEYNY